MLEELGSKITSFHLSLFVKSNELFRRLLRHCLPCTPKIHWRLCRYQTHRPRRQRRRHPRNPTGDQPPRHLQLVLRYRIPQFFRAWDKTMDSDGILRRWKLLRPIEARTHGGEVHRYSPERATARIGLSAQYGQDPPGHQSCKYPAFGKWPSQNRGLRCRGSANKYQISTAHFRWYALLDGTRSNPRSGL